MDSTFKIEKENILNSKEDSIFRCQKCGLIPFIGINIKDDKILVETKCENSHFTKTEINKFLNSFNSNSYKFKCYNCNKEKIDLYYWPDCQKFFCNNCKYNIPEKSINAKKFDSMCKNNLIDYSGFCLKCGKNQCIYCNCPHDKEKIYYNSCIITNNEIKNIKINLNKGREFIEKISKVAINFYKHTYKGLMQLEQNIIEFKERNNYLIQLCEKIMNCYDHHVLNKNINYQIIQNVRNVLKFKLIIKPSIYDVFNLLNNFSILKNSNLDIDDSLINDDKYCNLNLYEKNDNNYNKENSKFNEINNLSLTCMKLINSKQALNSFKNNNNIFNVYNEFKDDKTNSKINLYRKKNKKLINLNSENNISLSSIPSNYEEIQIKEDEYSRKFNIKKDLNSSNLINDSILIEDNQNISKTKDNLKLNLEIEKHNFSYPIIKNVDNNLNNSNIELIDNSENDIIELSSQTNNYLSSEKEEINTNINDQNKSQKEYLNNDNKNKKENNANKLSFETISITSESESFEQNIKNIQLKRSIIKKEKINQISDSNSNSNPNLNSDSKSNSNSNSNSNSKETSSENKTEIQNQDEENSKQEKKIFEITKSLKDIKVTLSEIFKTYPSQTTENNKNIKIVYNYLYKDNSFYSGEMNLITKEREGRGILIDPDGSYRIGYFHNNLQEKKGIWHYVDKLFYYEGEFFEDLQQGFGKCYWDNGDYFFGYFYDSNLVNGDYHYKDGTIYSGGFKNGKKNGVGQVYDPVCNVWKDMEFKNDVVVEKKKR